MDEYNACVIEVAERAAEREAAFRQKAADSSFAVTKKNRVENEN